MFFIDSSIIVESLKEDGNEKAREIWKKIIELQFSLKFFTNIIVFSEVTYQLIIKGKHKNMISKNYIFAIFDALNWCNSNYFIKNLAQKYIIKYNLASNDAIILATCNYYKIFNIITLDDDFNDPAKSENINVICSIESLLKELK